MIFKLPKKFVEVEPSLNRKPLDLNNKAEMLPSLNKGSLALNIELQSESCEGLELNLPPLSQSKDKTENDEFPFANRFIQPISPASEKKHIDSMNLMIINMKNSDFEPYWKLEKTWMNEHLTKTVFELTQDLGNIDTDQNLRKILGSTGSENDISQSSHDGVLTVDKFIEICVLPKWKSYMVGKTKRREIYAKHRARTDTLLKKIIRDVREFFRIYFRMRFDHSRLSNIHNALTAMKTMFDEVGLPLSQVESKNKRLYGFIQQTHKTTARRLFRRVKQDGCKESPFDIIEDYSEDKLMNFFEDPLASRMLYFVLSNYMKDYVPLISINYRTRLTSLVCCILKCYKKMKCRDNVPRIKFWIR